jgi:phospholipase C
MGNTPCKVEIIDHAYKSNNQQRSLPPAGKSTLVLNLEKSYGWYDFSITVAGSKHFEKRYAGRVETGQPGYTDPFMGRVVA